MDILNIFKSDKDGIRKSHIKNLISVAMADGHIDTAEWEHLAELGSLVGMTEREILKIKEDQDSIIFQPPKDYDARLQQVKDLVAIMTIDGEIKEEELLLCKKISMKLDILPQVVDQIVEASFAAKK